MLSKWLKMWQGNIFQRKSLYTIFHHGSSPKDLPVPFLLFEGSNLQLNDSFAQLNHFIKGLDSHPYKRTSDSTKSNCIICLEVVWAGVIDGSLKIYFTRMLLAFWFIVFLFVLSLPNSEMSAVMSDATHNTHRPQVMLHVWGKSEHLFSVNLTNSLLAVEK